MGLHYSPRIVTDGLVLALDAADTNSYPGTGDIWYDLSGNNYHATKYGNPNWNSSGYWEFRNVIGDNDFEYFITMINEGILKSENTSGQWSVEVVFKDQGTAYSGSNMIVGRLGFHAGILQASNGTAVIGQISSDDYPIGNIRTDDVPTINNNWYHVIFRYNNKFAELFVNGVLSGSGLLGETVNIRAFNDYMYIGGINNDMYRTYIDLSLIRMYSKSLSDTEIKQNYAAQKNRFI